MQGKISQFLSSECFSLSTNRSPLFVSRPLYLTTMLLVAVVSTVVLVVTLEGQRDTRPRSHTAELVGWVAGRRGCGYIQLHSSVKAYFVFLYQEQICRSGTAGLLTTLLLVAHVPTVVVPVALPDAADAAAVGAAVLVGQTAVL